MIVYHASYMEIKIPDLSYGRRNLDFGKGFYVTTMKAQAEKWAIRQVNNEKAKGAKNIAPVVNVYEFSTDGLQLLRFDGYTEEWLDFVVKNRKLIKPVSCDEYDAIFGNVADDDVANVVDDYIRLLNKGRLEQEDKNFFIRQLRFSKPNDQYCLVTEKAIQAIKFISCYKLEG